MSEVTYIFLVFSIITLLISLLVLERVYYTINVRDSGSPVLTYALCIAAPVVYSLGLILWLTKSGAELEPNECHKVVYD
jgi:hypothetical protein